MVIFQQMQPFSKDINFDRRFSQGCPGFRTAAGGFALTETLEGTLNATHDQHELIHVAAVPRDGQFRRIYYSRIVIPNPKSKSFFFAITTIDMKPFITSLQQQKHNERTSLLQCNAFKLSTHLLCVGVSF